MTLQSREQLLDLIASPRTRSAMHAYVRRRGLGDSAEDLVQTALCDALAAPAVPVASDELPRWLNGILRNKVVDERRRRARWGRAEADEPATPPAPVDALSLLRRIEHDVTAPEERRALSWLVREHAGDSLYLIALEQSLSPDTLRQRVCRLRKALRARYLAPLALALGLGAAWATQAAVAPTAASVLSSSLASYSGQWRVVRSAPSRYETLDLSVSIEGPKVRVFGPSEAVGRSLVVERLQDDQVSLSSGSSRWVGKLELTAAGRLRLTTARGFVELERRP